MKNFLFAMILVIFFVMSFYIIGKKQVSKEVINSVENQEVRSVFVSYLELEKHIKNKTTEASKKNIIGILDNLKSNNFNSIIIHVRPFSDAIYNSEIFPISETVKVNGKSPSYDVLKFIIDEAHKRGISVHAWINPYRISTNTDTSKLNGVASTFFKNGEAKVVASKGIYYNPASKNVSKLILSGIKELVTNYDVDGIHFDDYFYPSKEIDLEVYNEYISSGGEMSINEFRYDIILSLIKDVYWTIKSIKPKVLFGISPEGNLNNNYNNHYLDIKTILSNDGYVDYIMPQIYFGFDNSNKPFKKTLQEWNSLIKNGIKIIPALAFYKSGEYDKYAGVGEYEWITNNDIIKRQVDEIKKVSNYGGFSVFRYDSMFNPNNSNKKQEFVNLKEILNNE